MIDRALEQVGDGRQTDVWMRPHVRAATRCEVPRTHVVEEDEWADHLTMANRQHAAHGVAITKITDAALQDIDDRLGVFGQGSLVTDGDWRIRQPLVETCVSRRAERPGAWYHALHH